MYALTDHVQRALRARWNGYAPPGTCTLVGLPEGVSGAGKNAWGTHTLAVVPTMKRPEEVGWNRELVYNGMWALLCEVERWNAAADARAEAVASETGAGGVDVGGPGSSVSVSGTRISRVLMTGLGTGAGGVSAERCARQMVLAVKHFEEGVAEHARWETVQRQMEEVEETWKEAE